ncbi:MAG: ComEC/Rec2 family competence protein [Chloroflexi bacterium]|nr:ComEC/Rec2 family competence protein [Chloroflexota bacterium]
MLLVYLAAAWVAGITVASLIPLPQALWGLWLALPAGLLAIWRHDSILRRVHVCFLLFVLAALRYTVALPHFDERSLASFNDRGATTLVGIVTEPPDVRDRTLNLRVSITQIRVDQAWRDVSGMALVQAPRETDVRYGDQIQIYGEPTTPPEFEDFSYKEYLARQGIHSLVRTYGGAIRTLARDQGDPFYTALYAFKARALTTVHAIFPEPAASLLAGILLGDDSGMPRDLAGAFSATNTAHIIAISGFNVAILVGLFSALARRVFGERWLATLVVILGLAIYTLLVGASPSVVRAAIMGGLAVLARHLHRPNDALNALALAALAMTAHNPFVVFDLSFQLSFLATLGLIQYVQPLTRWFEDRLARIVAVERARQIVGALGDSLIVTLAAQITTTPLIVFAFHRLSLVGLVTNLLALPAQPAVMTLGGLATLVAMVVQPIGQLLAWIAWAFLEWTIVVVQATANLPLAALDIGRMDVLLLALYYVSLFGYTYLRAAAPTLPYPHTPLTPPLPHSHTPTLAMATALVLLVWFYNLAANLPDGKTHIEFLDAGSAATLVRTPSGARVLIDGGANPSVTLAALGEGMPFWQRSLELLVLTNPDDAHLAGLVVALERYDVQQIVQVRAPAKPTAAYLKWHDLVSQKRVPTQLAQPGLQIALDQNLRFEILQLGDNDGCAIARLQAAHLALLFADSASENEQAAFVESSAEPSTVLVAPRRITPEFLDAVDPQFTILFAGPAARDQPSADLLAAFSQTTLLRADEHGTIEITTDGRTLAVRTAR